MRNKSKYLVKNVLLFSLSSFLQKLFAFLLVPIYTSYLTSGEYGIADLVSTTTSFLIPIFSLDIQDSILRFVMDSKYDNEEILSNFVYINFVGFIMIVPIMIIIYILNLTNLPLYFFIYCCILFIANTFQNSFVMYCKGIEKVKSIVVSSTILSLSTILLNIVFLTVFRMGVHGYLLSMVIGYTVSTLYLIISTKLHKQIKLKKKNKKVMKEMILYRTRLIFSVIAWWINNASDRYIITWILGVSASGIYAMSYRIPNIISIFYGIFSQAWTISAIKEFDKNDEDGFIGNTYMIINALLCLLCSSIMIFNIIICKMLFLGDFFVAWKYTPALLYAIVFYSNAMFLGNIFVAVKDTKFISLSTIISAIINTILNIVLINILGVIGAAIATLVGYFSIYLMRIIFVRKYIKIKYNSNLVFGSFILLFIQMILACYGNKFVFIQCIIFIVLIVMYRKYILNIISKVKLFLMKKVKKV